MAHATCTVFKAPFRGWLRRGNQRENALGCSLSVHRDQLDNGMKLIAGYALGSGAVGGL